MADAVAQFSDVRFNKIPFPIRERWKLIRDVISGDQVLRTTGDYLPYLNKNDTSTANVARNTAYRTRAVWFPACGFTLEGFLGLAFRVDPTSTLEGTRLESLITNVDGNGVSLYQQSQASLSDVISIGRHGLLTDFVSDDNAPIIKGYAAETIINERYAMEGGKKKLVLLVLEETVEEADGMFAVKYVKQWREFFIDDDTGYCMVRVWRELGMTAGSPQSPGVGIIQQPDAYGIMKDEIVIRSPGKVFTEIPFTFIGSKNNDGTIDPAPMYGLAALNLAHFRNSADYEDSVFFVGQVQPYITGLDEEWRDQLENPKDAEGRPTGDTIYIGSRKPILLPQGATFGYAQAMPNMLVKEAMDQKEAQMVKIGARILEGAGPGARTATEDDNDKEAATSVLSMCVANTNEAYQKAIYWCAQYLDMGEDFDAADAYKITQQFVRAAANPALVDSLVKMWQTGVLAKGDVRDHLRAVGLIATERSDEDIEADIETDGPPLGMLGLAGTGIAGAPPVAGKAGATPPGNPGTAKPPGKPVARR